MAENKYTALTDEQLALQAQNGDAEAEEYLLTRFKDMVLSRAAIYYIVGGDRDDVVQEGMIGLVKAIRGYKEEQGSFSNFAYVCVTRQIISAVRSAWIPPQAEPPSERPSPQVKAAIPQRSPSRPSF